MSYAEMLEFGVASEDMARNILVNNGYSVIQIKNDEAAPLMYTPDSDFVLPDIIAWRERKPLFFEVKTRSVAAWYTIGQCWTVSVNKRHLDDYCSIIERTGIPVYIMFFLLSDVPQAGDAPYAPPAAPKGVFLGALGTMKPDNTRRENGEDKVYFDVERLEYIGTIK